MITLYGIPLNFNHPILAKVKRKYGQMEEDEEKFVLLLGGKDVRSGVFCKCVITNAKQETTIQKYGKISIVYDTKDANILNVGDIVLIQTIGRITIVYQNNSNDNSLLVTQRCNCKCVMCPQLPTEDDENMTPFNLDLIELIDKDAKSLAFTGGEPTLLKEDFLTLVAECKQKLPRTSLIVLTNGIAFEDSNYVKDLISISHPDITIAVSLYSDLDTQHDRIIGNHGFYRTVNGIYNLASFKQKIEIRTVIHKLTYERIPNLAEFISHNFPFIIHTALMGLEITGLACKNVDKLWIDPYEYRNFLMKAVQILHRSDLNVSIYNHQLCILPTCLWKFARSSISEWKRLYLKICTDCSVKHLCGGLFASSEFIHSKYLYPLTKSADYMKM
jgi:His-Xaa-Ser system radical SAM maturase HxsC